MPSTVRSKKQHEQDDLTLAKQVKPHLRKFVIDEQTKRADAKVTSTEAGVTKLAKRMSPTSRT
jgi:hypothetical protein